MHVSKLIKPFVCLSLSICKLTIGFPLDPLIINLPCAKVSAAFRMPRSDNTLRRRRRRPQIDEIKIMSRACAWELSLVCALMACLPVPVPVPVTVPVPLRVVCCCFFLYFFFFWGGGGYVPLKGATKSSSLAD